MQRALGIGIDRGGTTGRGSGAPSAIPVGVGAGGVICHDDGTTGWPVTMDHLFGSLGMIGGRRAGVNCGFLAASVGLSFDDEFVCCRGDSVDSRLCEQGVGHDGQPFSGLRLEVSTVEARWWRATTSS